MSSFISGLWWISPGWVTNGLFLGSVLYGALSSCFKELFLHFDSLWSTSAPTQSTWTPSQRAISWTHTLLHLIKWVIERCLYPVYSHHTLQCLPGVSGVNTVYTQHLFLWMFSLWSPPTQFSYLYQQPCRSSWEMCCDIALDWWCSICFWACNAKKCIFYCPVLCSGKIHINNILK